MRNSVAALFAIAICCPTVARGLAQDLPANRAAVRGIDGVLVAVEPLDPESKAQGLTEDLLRTEVELQLLQAGLRVRTRGEFDSLREKALLYVRVSCMKNASCFGYTVSLGLRQEVVLVRDPGLSLLAETWSIGGVGAIQADNMKEAATEAVRKYVDRFLSAWKPASQD